MEEIGGGMEGNGHHGDTIDIKVETFTSQQQFSLFTLPFFPNGD